MVKREVQASTDEFVLLRLDPDVTRPTQFTPHKLVDFKIIDRRVLSTMTTITPAQTPGSSSIDDSRTSKTTTTTSLVESQDFTTVANAEPNSNGSTTPTMIIIIAVVGFVVILCLTVGLFTFFRRRNGS
jgi:hypothetical protein